MLFPASFGATGVWVAGGTAGRGWPFLGVALLLGLCAAWRAPRVGAHLALLAACFFFGGALGSLARAPLPFTVPRSPTAVEGRIEATSDDADSQRIDVAIRRLGDRTLESPVRARLYLRGGASVLLPGAEVALTAQLRAPRPPDNPGGWDASERLHRHGVELTGSARPNSVRVTHPPAPLARWLASTHQALAERTAALSSSPEATAFYLTLAAGRRAELGAEWERRFARSGLAHLLSVSGLHVAALAWMVLALIRFTTVRFTRLARTRDARRIAAAAAIPWIWAYVWFSGNQPPAVRSAVMASAVFVGFAIARRADALNALAGAVVALLLFDPSAIADLSLQLSVLAVLALVLVAPALTALLPAPPPDERAHSRGRRLWGQVRDALVTSLSASIAVTAVSVPLVAAAFHRLSVAGLVTNVVCLPLGGALTLLSAGGAALFVVSPLLATPFLYAGTRFSEVFLAIASHASEWRWASIPVASLPSRAAALYLLGIGVWALGAGRVRLVGLVSPAILLATWVAPIAFPSRGLTVTFLAVGHGDAVLLSSQGAHALIDGGDAHVGERVVVPALREASVAALDLTVLSHPHADHAAGLAETLVEVPTRWLWVPAGSEDAPLTRRLIEAARGAEVLPVSAGAPPFVLGEALLWAEGPPAEFDPLDGVNDRSVVVRVRHGDVQILLTGDIEAVAEDRLPATPVTILKAPHHGSRTSSTPPFVAKLHPRYVVFCVADGGRFHFPAPEVEDRYAASGARCLRTAREGAVRFVSDGKDVQVQTYSGGRSGSGDRGWLPIGGSDPTLESMISPDLDLQSLTENLKAALKPGEPIGYLRGKSLMRDVLVQHNGFSELEAEELVDTLELRGYLHFLGDPAERSMAESHWSLDAGHKG